MVTLTYRAGASKVNANGKRSREEDESDSAYHDARYHARKRFEGNGNGSTRTMQAPASLTPLDKGKRKMTAAEVEKSIREDEQMSHHSRPQPNRKATALRRTEEAIELDTTIMAAPARADHRHLINSTSSQQLPSPDVLVPRPNHKDSRKQVGR
jgi:hypothetical protein